MDFISLLNVLIDDEAKLLSESSIVVSVSTRETIGVSEVNSIGSAITALRGLLPLLFSSGRANNVGSNKSSSSFVV